jgi:hypothetical protein
MTTPPGGDCCCRDLVESNDLRMQFTAPQYDIQRRNWVRRVIFLACYVATWSVLSLYCSPRADADNAARTPFPTGSHLQLVREFYSTADGLTGDDIRAIAVARDGSVLVASKADYFEVAVDHAPGLS